jgi:hypothetical protein
MVPSRNVVLVCLDCVRKDYFDEYASRIQSISDISIDQCRAAATWSAPSHASMFSGVLPHEHGVHHGSLDFATLSDTRTIYADLDEAYHIGISANKYAGPSFNFDRYFDEFHTVTSHSLLANGINVDQFYNETEFDGFIDKNIRFLKECINNDNKLQSIINGLYATLGNSIPSMPLPRLTDDGGKHILKLSKSRFQDVDEPFFAFVNFMDAHGPHQPSRHYDSDLYSGPVTFDSGKYDKWELNIENVASEQYISHLRELYASSIEYLDRLVAQLATDIQSVTDKPTTIIVTADHGENLGYDDEDGLYDHTSSLSEALLHVPLEIINSPPKWKEPPHTSPYFSHLFLPDMCKAAVLSQEMDSDWFDTVCAAEIIGMSGIGFGDRRISEDNQKYWNRMIRCVYKDSRKFVWDSLGDTRMYKIDKHNPCDQQSLSSDSSMCHGLIDNFFDEEIDEYKWQVEESSEDINLNPEMKRQLEQLGYM